MNYFPDVEKKLFLSKTTLKDSSIVREGNYGQIQKVLLVQQTSKDKEGSKQKYSFYGTLLDLDFAYVSKSII